MEFLTVLPSISLVVAVLCILVVIMIKKAGSTSASTTADEVPLPPGPWKLPLIGSMHHLAKSELPHHALTRLGREHGPVMHLQMGQVGLVVISSREAAREVMKVQDATFAHRPELTAPKALLSGCTDIVFSSGPYWRRLRKMCVVELLGANRVKSFAPIRREETRALLESIAGQPPGTAVDLRAMLAPLSSAIVSRTAFGKIFEHRGSIMKEGLELTSGFSLSDLFPSLSFLDVPMRLRLRRVHREVDKVLDDIIGERKRLRLCDSDVAQLSYLKLVIRETLRLHPPAPLLIPRVCKQQCRLLGYTIPAGSRVVINAWAMGRDQRYWEDAETFRPGRFVGSNVDYKGANFEFVPFGAGRRICPGIEFGLAIIELCLAQLLFYFDWKLPGGMAPEDLNMSETSVGVGVVRKEPLRLIPNIHVPLGLEY